MVKLEWKIVIHYVIIKAYLIHSEVVFKVVEQKLNYIHLNPLQEQWNLVSKPEDYRWSSARFYETGIDDFGFITHYRDRF